jgi:glucosamine--fructose-6-phosphate aminotransferase (isomerizing)
MATEGNVALPEAAVRFRQESDQRLSISACGTAYYAGLVAKYWFERYRAAAGR